MLIHDIDKIMRSLEHELVIDPCLGFSKESTSKVSPDSSRWDMDALHALYEAHSFITPEYGATVQWIKKEDHQGYGIGAVILSNKSGVGYTSAPRENVPSRNNMGMGSSVPGVQVAIPIIIKGFELFPMDIMRHGDHWYPLTERRLGQAFHHRDMFSGVEKYEAPGDSSRGLVDMMAPPYEAAYGNYSRYGGGNVQGGGSGMMSLSSDGMGKRAVVLPGRVNVESIIDRLLPTIDPDHIERWRGHVSRSPGALVAFARGGKLDVLRRAAGAEISTSDDERDWVQSVLPKDLVRVSRLDDGLWCATMVSDKLFDPLQLTDTRERIIDRLKKSIPDIESRMMKSNDILIEGDSRETVSPLVIEDLDVSADDASGRPGTYVVMTRRGEVLKGAYVDPVLNYDGSDSGWGLWSDGTCYSISDVTIGSYVGEDIDLPKADMCPGESATFIFQRDGGYGSVVPFIIRSVCEADDHVVVQAFDLFKRPVNFIITPGASSMVSVTGITDPELGGLLDGNAWIIPEHWMLVGIGRQVRLWDKPEHVRENLEWDINSDINPHGKEVLDGAQDPTIESPTVSIRHHQGRFCLKGSILDSVTGTQRVEDVDETEATFILSCLGMSSADAQNILGKAADRDVIRVTNLRLPSSSYREKTSGLMDLASMWNKDLFLEAAGVCVAKERLRPALEKQADELYSPHEESVEAVLGLGLVTTDNLMDILERIPMLQECESNLAELLLYTRAGFDAIPDDSVSRALRGLNEVLEDLEVSWALMRQGSP